MADKNYSTRLKEQYTPDIIDEVIAFANSEGGVIYIGIREDGTVIGTEDPAGTASHAAREILEAIQPDISAVVQVRTVQLKGKDLVAVMVGKGDNKPYSRIAASIPTPAEEPSAIGVQPVHVTGRFNENDLCPAQLHFSTLKLALDECDIPSDSEHLHALHLTDTEGRYTNLALLLSEQCPFSIKVTLFNGCDKSSISHSSTIGGSILQQLVRSCTLIEKLTESRNTDSYPQDAVSEAILNAIVHRDYSYSGSTLVNIFDDRIEIVSLGGLPSGLSMEAVDMGISQPRYPNLADTLCRIELMECCGCGISKIRGLYSGYDRSPEFESVQGAFRTVLPNLSYAKQERTAPDGYKALVLQLVKERGFVVRSDVEQLAGLKTTAAYNLIKELCADGELIQSGVGKKTIYKLP